MSTFPDYSSQYLNDPSKELFPDSTITRFAQEGENAFAVEYPCILSRLALDITTGVKLYTLPDTVTSIRRVTWRGYKLDPLPLRAKIDVFQNATQIGRPFWYVFNNVGLNKIQFFPIPDETIVASQANLTSDGILTNVIVEYFQAPDFITKVIPPYIKRRLLKTYALRGCFNVEGQGQSLKNAKYWKAKWMFLKEKYGLVLAELHNKPRKLVVNSIQASYYFPGSPVLPIDRFGISVNTGE